MTLPSGITMAKKMMAKLIPSRRKIVVSSLRCRMRATDCTMGECRNACSCSSADLGAGAAAVAAGGALAVAGEPEAGAGA
jgi:hypothetical protein